MDSKNEISPVVESRPAYNTEMSELNDEKHDDKLGGGYVSEAAAPNELDIVPVAEEVEVKK